MMLSTVSQRIRAQCPTIKSDSPAPAFRAAELHAHLFPCAVVAIVDETAQPSRYLNTHAQRLTRKLGVIIGQRNLQPKRHDDEFDQVRIEVLAALCGWTPTSPDNATRSELEYAGCRMVFPDLLVEGQLWTQFDFNFTEDYRA